MTLIEQIFGLSSRIIPSGGTTGQVLSKVNNTDYNVQWTTPSTGGSFTETDPIFLASEAASITDLMIADWNNAAAYSHFHANFDILDTIIDSGDGSRYFGDDGLYHVLPITVPGSDTQVIYNNGGVLGAIAGITIDDGAGRLSATELFSTDYVYFGDNNTYIRNNAGSMTFYDSDAALSITLAELITGATNYWSPTSTGIFYGGGFISNHIDPTAELDIAGTIIATDFSTANFKYDAGNNILIGTSITPTGINQLYIDNNALGTSSISPLIYGEFDNRILQVNGEFTLGYGIVNFEDANQRIFSDLGVLYVQDTTTELTSPVSLSSFIDGTFNALKSEFTAYSTVTSISAANVSNWNTAYSQRHIHGQTNLLQWTGGASNYYGPYPSKTLGGSFYSGTDVPDGIIRLNYNGYFYATKLFVGGSEVTSGLTPTDNIFDWDGANSWYAPYSTQQAFLSFDTSATAPTLSDSLNLNGYLNVTALYGMALVSAPSVAVNDSSTSSGGGLNVTMNETYGTDYVLPLITINRSVNVGSNNVSGNIINITDNPTSSGTISGKAFSYIAGVTERISFDPRVANSGTNVAYILDTHNALSGTTKLLSIRNQGTERAYVDNNGYVIGARIAAVSGTTGMYVDTTTITGVVSSSNKMLLNPSVADGASAVAYNLNTASTLSTAGSKLISVQNNTVERFRVTPTTTDIGDIAGGNYTSVESDGTIKFNGNATIWQDINVAGVELGAGAASPDLIAVNGTVLQVRAFDGGATTEELFGVIELPHSYREGSDITAHVHWMPTTTGAGNVKWNIDYQWVNAGDTYANTVTTVSATAAASTTAWDGTNTDIATITGTGKTISSHFMFRLYRNPADVADTYADDAALIVFGLHIEGDTIGSRGIITK